VSHELAPPRILRGLRTTHLGWPLEVLESCPSTNDRALDLLASGAPHGTLVVSEQQTRGRGQRGREWHSPAGVAIYASLLLRGERSVATPTLLVASVGLGLAEGLEAVAGLEVGVKWPNDLWVGDAKLAGVLVEARGFRAERPAFVAGFGVNVNQRREDFPAGLSATSLALVAGRRFDRATVLRALLDALEPRVDQALSGAVGAEFHQAYRRRSVLVGRRVALLDGDSPVEGVVTDLSASDGLLLRTDDGRHLHVLAEHAREVRPLTGRSGHRPGP
jgi:BirA family transcriptional regulator, biotin operon repressor / biotin---[acetyl-CoA-carboxylase] ligase